MKKNNLLWACVFVFILAVLACTLPTTESPPPAIITAEIVSTFPKSATSVKITLETGDDGTADSPVFGMFDSSGNTLFTITLNRESDLQPNQTDTYEFSVPYPFCQIIGWQMTKPSSSGVDDSWLPTEITIEMDGKMVWLDRLFSDLGEISESSQRGGNWSAIDIYKQQCEQ